MMGRSLKNVVLAAGLAFLAPFAAAADTLPSIDELTRYFETIVFGSELGAEYASPVVAKWQGTIGIDLQGRVTERHAQFLETHLKALAGLTKLRFKKVPAKDNTHGISYLFLPHNQMDKIPVGPEHQATMRRAALFAGCYFLSFKKPASRIVKAIVVVDIERDPARINACLLEETAQSLGLPNDSDDLRPSIFSDLDTLYEPSPQDQILLRTLYDPRMKAGLTRAQAVATARNIITELAGKR